MVIMTHFYSHSLFPKAWCFFTCLSLVLLGVGAWRSSSKKKRKRWELNTYNSEKYACRSHQDHQECKHWDVMHCLWDHLRPEVYWESGIGGRHAFRLRVNRWNCRGHSENKRGMCWSEIEEQFSLCSHGLYLITGFNNDVSIHNISYDDIWHPVLMVNI